MCETWKRYLDRNNKPWEPIKTWCRSGTAEWLQINHPYEWNKFLKPYISNEFKPPGSLLNPINIEFSNVEVVPVAVSVDLMSNADYLFIECNTWRVEGVGHTTFLKAEEYIKALKPKQTFLVHLSGHEDRPQVMTGMIKHGKKKQKRFLKERNLYTGSSARNRR